MGGKGVISVLSNIYPEICVKMVNAALSGDFATAAKIQLATNKINHAMFMESNPLPVKEALHLMKKCENIFRPPLANMEDANLAKLADIIKDFEKTKETL